MALYNDEFSAFYSDAARLESVLSEILDATRDLLRASVFASAI